MSGGYYDKEGYWHRGPPQGQQPPRRGPARVPAPPPPPPAQPAYRPVRDPYYDQYRGAEVYYDQYGRPVMVRRQVLRPYGGGRMPRTRKLGMFSAREVLELVVATLVLTAAFTISWGNVTYSTDPLAAFLAVFPLSLLVTATAFTAHEMSHKFMAQRYGFPAEFVINPIGMLMALGSAIFFGWVIALPGAVVFSGSGGDPESVGKVGAAGPLMNICIAVAFLPVMILFPALWMVVYLNVFLAGFNMLPFGQFDGLKIWRWNKGIYIAMLLVIVGLFVYSLFLGGFFTA